MTNRPDVDWPQIRERAARFPEAAFAFVRDGLSYAVKTIHGEKGDSGDRPRHVSGQQLCRGLRAFALDRYGQLARTVFRRWGVCSTEDFGVIVYAMIDREEMRASEQDRFGDFQNVYDFDEAFGPAAVSDRA